MRGADPHQDNSYRPLASHNHRVHLQVWIGGEPNSYEVSMLVSLLVSQVNLPKQQSSLRIWRETYPRHSSSSKASLINTFFKS